MDVETAMGRLSAENERLGREIRALEGSLRDAMHEMEQLQALVYLDSLTGLPNRRWLADSLQTMLSAHAPQAFAVLFVDLDDFRRINEALGHRDADTLLRELAETLDGVIRSIDVLRPHRKLAGSVSTQRDGLLSRLGGDEFVILLPGIRERAAAATVASRILKRLERPFQVGARSVVVTASIGIALHPSDGHTADALVTNADAAMYTAKQRGKARYEHYCVVPPRSPVAASK